MNTNKKSRMSGLLDRRGKFGFWSRRFCVLRDEVMLIFRDEGQTQLEKELPVDHETEIIYRPEDGLRFTLIGHDKVEHVFRGLERSHVMSWVLTLRSICICSAATLDISSFNLIRVIGQGYYGKVTLVQKVDTGAFYAMKTIHKSKLMKCERLHTILTERKILLESQHPFIVSISYAFQSPVKFYMCLEYVPGGELYHHIQHEGWLSEREIRLYASEIILALQYLHSRNIIYRDLKSENVLLDAEGHIKLTDFGLSKDLCESDSASTFCGTCEYLAPEIIKHVPYGMAIDWWSLGILLYEMAYGITPFASPNRAILFNRIVECDIPFPKPLAEDLSDLIQCLLEKDPVKRLAFGKNITNHKFFKGIVWDDVMQKKIKPRYVPDIGDALDTMALDENFGEEKPVDSVGSSVDQSMHNVGGFSYDADDVLSHEM